MELNDSQQNTALGVALWNGHYDVAQLLVTHGSDVNCRKDGGLFLLHEAILRKDDKSAIFLLDCKVNLKVK